MTEFIPGGSKPKMTQAQVRRYIKELEEKRKNAQIALEKAKQSWEFSAGDAELSDLEKKLDNLL